MHGTERLSHNAGDAKWRETLLNVIPSVSSGASAAESRQRQRYLLHQQQSYMIRCGEEIPLVANAPGGMTFKSLRSGQGENNMPRSLVPLTFPATRTAVRQGQSMMYSRTN